MEKQEYFDEIALIIAQNNTEYELYPLVGNILAPALRSKGLTKRYVFPRRLSNLGWIYYGISSFPDIAILDRTFDNEKHHEICQENWAMLRGCVEAKAWGIELWTLKALKDAAESAKTTLQTEAAQLLGEILWYKKVLYTNGSKWVLFTYPYEPYKEDVLEIARNQSTEQWWQYKTIPNAIGSIEETVLSENCEEDWDALMKKIDEIDW